MILKLAFSLIVAVLACAPLATSQAPATWRYNLHSGDHLVYSYTFHREVRTDEAQTTVEAHFRTQVLIAGERGGVLSAGFQRNRESAELLVYRLKGKNKLAEERPQFEKRMQARPAQFSEAMEFTASGDPRYSWEIARESSSHLLPALHEIEVLPPRAVKVGERWHAMDLLGIEFEWIGWETVLGTNCFHVRGTTSDGTVTISYWWSLESKTIERVELDGSYPVPGGTSHEQARMQLESRSRNESLSDWLGKPETRLGALEALLLSPTVPVTGEQLASALNTANPGVQRLAPAPANPPSKSCAPPLPNKADPPKLGTLFRVALPTKPGPGIPYFLRIPLTYRGDRPTSLLVYLSGGPGLALDGVNTANDVISSTDYLVLYPQAGEYWWKAEIAERLDAALRDTFNEFNVDPDRVYLAGFSNGGTGALYMAALWPQRFAAVVSLMGAGQCNEDVQKRLPNLANVPLLLVHGEKDPIIAPDCTKATHEAIGALRPRTAPQLRLLPDREHDITLTSDNGLTLSFLKDKVREPFPKRITARIPDAIFPRQYWVEVLEKKSGMAEVNAEIKQGNEVEIRSHEVKKLRLYLRPEMFPQAGLVRVRWNGKQVFEGVLQDVCAAAGAGTTADPKLEFADRKELSLP